LQQSNKLEALAAYNFKTFGQFEEHLGCPQDEVNLTSWQCNTCNVDFTAPYQSQLGKVGFK
jgi:hypothetical protein